MVLQAFTWYLMVFNNIQFPKISPWYPQDYPKIPPRFPQDSPKISPRFPQDFPKISPRFPQDSHLSTTYPNIHPVHHNPGQCHSSGGHRGCNEGDICLHSVIPVNLPFCSFQRHWTAVHQQNLKHLRVTAHLWWKTSTWSMALPCWMSRTRLEALGSQHLCRWLLPILQLTPF